MADIPHRLQQNAEFYARQRKLKLLDALGGGVNGSVWYTSMHSAVKAFELVDAYERERDVYFRLTEFDVAFINEFAVPRLRGFENELLVIEMDAVNPPFVLDFAGAYLDQPPDYTAEMIAEHEAKNAELSVPSGLGFGCCWPN